MRTVEREETHSRRLGHQILNTFKILSQEAMCCIDGKFDSTKLHSDIPFRPFCFNVFAESWMVLPGATVSGNFKSSKFPSVLSLATSSSVNSKEVSALIGKYDKAKVIS